MKTQLIDPKEILTTPQVCELLSVTRQTIYNWMQRGRVKPWMKVGGASWLFLRGDVVKVKDMKHRRD